MGSALIRRFHTRGTYDLMERSDLPPDYLVAVEATLVEQKESTNPKWRVAAGALSYDGDLIVVHNEDLGPDKHAEQVAISEFYRRVPTGRKKLKALVVVGARANEEVIRRTTPYGDEAELDGIECSIWLCGKCLEFIHDCTFNVKDVDIILVTITGQVLLTSLRSLFPKPHTSFVVPLEYLDGKVFPVPSIEEHKNNANGNGHGHGK